MKGKFGKIGIISLVLVLALGTMGAAFASWTETLTIDAPVNTGYLELRLTDTFYEDNETDDKDVGKVECSLEGGGGGNAFTELEVKVLNAYPGYEATIYLDIENTGTIPLRIIDCSWLNKGTKNWLDVTIKNPCTFEKESPFILKPGDSCKDGSITLKILEGEGCEENFTSDTFFTITIEAVQWNAP